MMNFQPLFPHISLDSPLLIAGPCSAETESQLTETAREVAKLGVKIFRAGIWKPRTKPGTFEGVGKVGLDWLVRAKRETGLMVATEVASPRHVELALKAGIDLLWIGARTVTNPFAVQEIAEALRGSDVPILVKNPVNPDIELWIGTIERLYNVGLQRLAAVHRGFSSYEQQIFRNPPQWQLPIELKRRLPNLPIVCDPSHIAGRADLVPTLAQQALDLNFDGLMIETHICPNKALSDAAQQLTPNQLKTLLDSLQVRHSTGSTDYLDNLRHEIDALDNELFSILAKRMKTAVEIGKYKRENGMAVLQTDRYNAILQRRVELGRSLNLDETFLRSLLETIHTESVRLQMALMKND